LLCISVLLLVGAAQCSLAGQVTKIAIHKRQQAHAANPASNDGDSVHLLNYLDAQVRHEARMSPGETAACGLRSQVLCAAVGQRKGHPSPMCMLSGVLSSDDRSGCCSSSVLPHTQQQHCSRCCCWWWGELMCAANNHHACRPTCTHHQQQWLSSGATPHTRPTSPPPASTCSPALMNRHSLLLLLLPPLPFAVLWTYRAGHASTGL
jgi:hypothetical protein